MTFKDNPPTALTDGQISQSDGMLIPFSDEPMQTAFLFGDGLPVGWQTLNVAAQWNRFA
jgi:hypothetical protein